VIGLMVLGWAAFGVAAAMIVSLRRQLARCTTSASTPTLAEPPNLALAPVDVAPEPNGAGSPKPAIEVKPRGDGRWVRQREGAKRPTAVHDTKAEAKRAAQAQAKRERAEVIVFAKNGRIESRQSFADLPDLAGA
jgi:hypothetical protein